MKLNDYLDIHPDVEDAIKNKLPIVALESTIISHGMPYPDNIETALMVEDTVRSNNAIPATIAIINGRLKVGLTSKEIEFLATNNKVRKVSRRDLAIAVSKKLSGSTTVASTMIIAELAKIAVFATGGIGGVHRGAEKTFDISADLEELSKTNVCVVCAGANANLEILKEIDFKEVERLGALLEALISENSEIKEIRRIGMMFAFDMISFERVEKVVKKCLEKGLISFWFLSHPYSFRLSPPITISEDEIRKAAKIINEAILETS